VLVNETKVIFMQACCSFIEKLAILTERIEISEILFSS
jgi:hypothetical protein